MKNRKYLSFSAVKTEFDDCINRGSEPLALIPLVGPGDGVFEQHGSILAACGIRASMIQSADNDL